MNPARVLSYVRKYPGSTCVEIARQLGENSAIVSAVLIEYRKAGKTLSSGNTKGTRWRVTP